MRRRLAAAACACIAASAAWATPTVAATFTARTTLPAVEQQVMCVTCGVPLAIAESPQADRERAFIRRLIAEGQTVAQIKAALVAQFGPAVLALPKAHGFNLAVYIVPAALLAALLGALAVALPRWRRRAAGATAAAGTPELSQSDRARLDEDLARYER